MYISIYYEWIHITKYMSKDIDKTSMNLFKRSNVDQQN